MTPRMSDKEQVLFSSVLATTSSYFEFGIGGSTILAAQTVKGCVCGVESDLQWVQSISEKLKDTKVPVRLHHADIGETKEWGFPVSNEDREKFLNYHIGALEAFGADFQTFLIDGRFRVACACAVALKAPSDSVFLVHDYSSRGTYRSIEQFARPIARAEDLTVFALHASRPYRVIADLLEAYQYDAN
jgi:hypothetical protein